MRGKEARKVLSELFQEGRMFKHYKGGEYVLKGFSLHTETEEVMVHYKDLEGESYARPAEMFFDRVIYDGKLMDRFEDLNCYYNKHQISW